MILRITTERKNVKWLYGLISEYFTGYTVYEVIGYWKDKREKSIVFEIDTAGFTSIQRLFLDSKIKEIVKKICGVNRQDAVLVQQIKSTSVMLGSNC